MHYLLSLLVLAGVGDPVPDATTTKRGYVNTGTQAFSGLKHFDGGIWTNTINGAPHAAAETVADMTLYISPDGGNSGSCTQAAPCQTLNGALRLVPKKLRHTVTVYAAPGLYPPEYSVIDDFYLDRGALVIEGAWQTATGIDGGSTSGTLTSVSMTNPFNTITDATQTWGTDTAKGKFVRITPDGGIAPVISNTATTLTLAYGVAPAKTPAASDSYELLEPAVIFQNDAGLTPSTIYTVTIRNISGDNLISTTLLLPDGGPTPSLNRVNVNKVEVRNAGAAFFSLTVQDVYGPRVELNDLLVTGATRFGGSISALSTTRSAFMTTASGSAAFNSTGNLNISNWTGGCYARSALASSFSLLRGFIAISTATNFVFETGSNTGHGLYLNGGVVWPAASSSNTGIISICPGSSTTGVGLKLSDSGVFGYGPSYVGTPALTVRGCSRGIDADNGRSEVNVTSYFEHNADGGTPIGITVSRGSKVRMTPAPVFTGISDELRIDGTVVDGGMATLNAATSQVLTGPYGSYISR